MSRTKTQELLNKEAVPFKTIWHPVAYSSQKTASFAHISGKEFAKPVMVRIDGKLCMVVLPASDFLSLDLLRQSTGARDVRLATESEFKDTFPDCEVGAMPPFGHLYGIPTFVSERLANDEWIAFNAGNHNELIEMAFCDYARLEHPRIAKVSIADV